MAICPFAVWRPLPENKTQVRITPRAFILHSASVNSSNIWSYFARDDVKEESHFFVKWNGVIEQFMDTEVKADANRYANPFGISVETEDDGDPNRQPWSPEQSDSLVRLFDWSVETHKIIRQLIPKWDGTGVGYHTMWGAPSMWTPVNKTCPGTIRIRQFNDQLLPRLLKLSRPPTIEEERDLMSAALNDTDARNTLIRQWFWQYLGRGPRTIQERDLHLWVFTSKGADTCLAGITDSEEHSVFRSRRGW